IKAGDRRVRVVGVVVDRRDSEITLDDRSGRISVIFDDPSATAGIEAGDRVRVIGMPLTVSGKTELRAETMKKVNDLDLELYDEFMKLVENMERGEVE
ncbi:MAG: OB-fold nucleic acid binding domain-containing protein, partial [Candidatus Hadarchaeales archaeon]